MEYSIEQKIQKFNSQECLEHKEPLILICINQTCEKSFTLLCSSCLESHPTHDFKFVKNFKKFLLAIYEQANNQQIQDQKLQQFDIQQLQTLAKEIEILSEQLKTIPTKILETVNILQQDEIQNKNQIKSTIDQILEEQCTLETLQKNLNSLQNKIFCDPTDYQIKLDQNRSKFEYQSINNQISYELYQKQCIKFFQQQQLELQKTISQINKFLEEFTFESFIQTYCPFSFSSTMKASHCTLSQDLKQVESNTADWGQVLSELKLELFKIQRWKFSIYSSSVTFPGFGIAESKANKNALYKGWRGSVDEGLYCLWQTSSSFHFYMKNSSKPIIKLKPLEQNKWNILEFEFNPFKKELIINNENIPDSATVLNIDFPDQDDLRLCVMLYTGSKVQIL